MRFFSTQALRNLDKETIQNGISGIQLMQRAATGLAEELYFLTDQTPSPVTILTGPGNNGGDGLGMAAILKRMGWPVEVWSVIRRDQIQGDPLHFLVEAEEAGVRFRWLDDDAAWEDAERFLMPNPVLVDALLGTGSRDEPRGVIASAVRFLRRIRNRGVIVSVDLPSGLDADQGHAHNPDCCVLADFTFTLGGAKNGFLQDKSAGWCGSITVVDLNFEPEALKKYGEGDWHVMGLREARNILPCRKVSAHKGSMGHVLVIGGSPGMTGAVSMAGNAALRTGSGLVTVLTPNTCSTAVDVAIPEVMVYAGRTGQFGTLNNQPLPMRGINGVLIGPGMRADYDTSDLLQRVFVECKVPLVLDADALTNLKGYRDGFLHTPTEKYLTPHPGEMANLLDMTPAQVQADRVKTLQKAGKRYPAHIVLKGSRSRIRIPTGRTWVNLNGNPGMGTGGSGDILAGIVTSLAAQGVLPEMVLPLAVFLHGKAGDLAMMRKGQAGMTAMDLLDALPKAIQRIQGR